MERLPFLKRFALLVPILVFLSIFSFTLNKMSFSELNFSTKNTSTNKLLAGQIKSDTTCQEPLTGCGSDYYWDSSSCSCVSSSSTNSTPCTPQYCGINRYWDSSSCSCKCAAFTACPTNQYWDTVSCSCLVSTSTNTNPTPTTAASTTNTTTNTTDCSQQYCGLNRYWDSKSCSCKCASYTACPSNQYWDVASCSCLASDTTTKTTDNSTSCTIAKTDCPANYYWNNLTCSCVYATTNFDRLAYETPEIISCVISKLTDSEYQKFRFFLPTNQEGFDEIQIFKDKAADCWTTKSESKENIQTQTTPLEKERCLASLIGEEAYRQIYEGKRKPTHNEHLSFEKCFGATRINTVNLLTKDEKLTNETISCLKDTLGKDLYQKVSSQKLSVPPEMKNQVASCFGAKPQPFEEGLLFNIPDLIRSCLRDSLGENKTSEILLGNTKASQEEKEKANLCFSNLNQEQIKFLPPLPEQVPFIDDTEKVKLTNVVQKEIEIKNKKYGGEVIFSGKALPDEGVYIYIFSDPIVVVSKTDENGDWLYEMQRPLSEGKHVAYALTKSKDGVYVRSSVFNFEVLASEDKERQEVFLDEGKQNETQKKFIYLSLTLILTTTLAVIGIIYLVLKNKKTKKGDASTSNGNSKTESGPGPIN